MKKNSAELIPAILTRDSSEIQEKLEFLEKIPAIKSVQIDFADGKFVSNETVLPSDLPTLETRLKIEAHLMVVDPQQHLYELERVGASAVVIHYESFNQDSHVENCLKSARALDFKVGLAVNPDTVPEIFSRFTKWFDFMLLMSVYPGFQGRGFLPETYERVKVLREQYKDGIIEVDGGIKLKNYQRVVDEGASRIIVGSGIWHNKDPKEVILEIVKNLKQ